MGKRVYHFTFVSWMINKLIKTMILLTVNNVKIQSLCFSLDYGYTSWSLKYKLVSRVHNKTNNYRQWWIVKFWLHWGDVWTWGYSKQNLIMPVMILWDNKHPEFSSISSGDSNIVVKVSDFKFTTSSVRRRPQGIWNPRYL